MVKKRPACDRHTNLMMAPHALVTSDKAGVYVCPVPGCGRQHDGEKYFDAAEVRTSEERHVPKSRHAAARAAIMKAIRQPQSTTLSEKPR